MTNVNLIFAILTIALYSQQHWAKNLYVIQLILVKIKWHIKWKYLIQIFHDICLSYYFKYLLNMFCYAKQVYEYCVCESTFIRGHQYSWYLQNALIHRLLNSWFHTLEVANQLKRFFSLNFHLCGFSKPWNTWKLVSLEE